MSSLSFIRTAYQYTQLEPEAPKKDEPQAPDLPEVETGPSDSSDQEVGMSPVGKMQEGNYEFNIEEPEVVQSNTDNAGATVSEAEVSGDASGQATVNEEAGDKKKLTKEERKAKREAEKADRKEKRQAAKEEHKAERAEFKAQAKSDYENKDTVTRYPRLSLLVEGRAGYTPVATNGHRDGSLFNSRGGNFGRTDHQGQNVGAAVGTNLTNGQDVQLHGLVGLDYYRWAGHYQLFGTSAPNTSAERVSSAAHSVATVSADLRAVFTFWDRVTGRPRPLAHLGIKAGLGLAAGRGTFEDSINHRQNAFGSAAEIYLNLFQYKGPKVTIGADAGVVTTLADGRDGNNNNWPITGGNLSVRIARSQKLNKPEPVEEPPPPPDCQPVIDRINASWNDIGRSDTEGLRGQIATQEQDLAGYKNYVENRPVDTLPTAAEVREYQRREKANQFLFDNDVDAIASEAAKEGKTPAEKAELAEKAIKRWEEEAETYAQSEIADDYDHWNVDQRAPEVASWEPDEKQFEKCEDQADLDALEAKADTVDDAKRQYQARSDQLQGRIDAKMPPRVKEKIKEIQRQISVPTENLAAFFKNDRPKGGKYSLWKSRIEEFRTKDGFIDYDHKKVKGYLKAMCGSQANADKLLKKIKDSAEKTYSATNGLVKEFDAVGHTSMKGPEKRNNALSLDRAKIAVDIHRDQMARLGANPSELKYNIEGKGESDPMDPEELAYKDDTQKADAEARNRRVNITVPDREIDRIVEELSTPEVTVTKE